jgi:hypothetical protein
MAVVVANVEAWVTGAMEERRKKLKEEFRRA